MRYQKAETLLTILASVLLVIAWLLSWYQTTLVFFLTSGLVKILFSILRFWQLTRQLHFASDDALTSLAIIQSQDSGREIGKGLALAIGEAAVWPFRGLIGMILGLLFARSPTPLGGQDHGVAAIRQLIFMAPLPLMILTAFILQCVFLMIAIPSEYRDSWAFQAATAFQLSGFLLFLGHFFLRRKFINNFSQSALSPALFYTLALVLVSICVVLIRQITGVVFEGYSDQISAENSFVVLKNMLLNVGVFEVFDVIEQSQDLAAFVASIVEYLQTITVLKAVDIILSVSLISTFGRSIWTGLTARRADEDRVFRASQFLANRNFERAAKEIKLIGDRRCAALVSFKLSLIQQDYPAFQAQLAHIPENLDIACFGRTGIGAEYLALTGTLLTVPLSLTEGMWCIEKFHEKNNHLGLSLSALFGYSYRWKMPLHENETLAQESRLVDIYSQAHQAIFDYLRSEVSLNEMGRNIFGDKYIEARLLFLQLFLGVAIGVAQEGPAINLRIKRCIDSLLAEILAEWREPEDKPLPRLVASMEFYQMRSFYRQAFDEESPNLSAILECVKAQITRGGHVVPKSLDRLDGFRIVY